MKYYILLFGCFVFSGCSMVSNLGNSMGKNQPLFNTDNNIEFLETRGTSGFGVTLADVLKIEKEKWGNDITLINIIEQSKVTYFLILPIGNKKYYVYDVVRRKKP